MSSRLSKSSAKRGNVRRRERRVLQRCVILALLAAALFAVGCAGPARIQWPDPGGAPAGVRLIDGIPFFPQDAYQCGPASLAMVLGWGGPTVSPEDLAGQVFTPSRKGSLQSAMIGAARRHDRIPFLLSAPDTPDDDSPQGRLDALTDEIVAGNPVIVLQNLALGWFPVWHYAVVIGVDPTGDGLILHSGRIAHKVSPAGVFTRTWARSGYWAMLVPRPGTLPATLDETACLEAVSAMARLERWAVAAEGYRAIIDRWPDRPAAYVGLGICEYRTGRLDEAEAVFRNAAARFPHSGIVYNNLAEVLQARGRRSEALAAATRAVALGGPFKAHFEETLESIRSRP